MRFVVGLSFAASLLVSSAFLACSGTGTSTGASPPGAGGEGGEGEAGGAGGAAGSVSIGGGAGGAAGNVDVGGAGNSQVPDPTTCAEAAASKTYLGCDFWPTVVDNIVIPLFDYAVVVANTRDIEVNFTVARGDMTIGAGKVPPNGLVKVYLPWVPELKNTLSVPFPGCQTDVKTQTVYAKQGAYHLTTDVPVAVYQFSPIEYAAQGGPPGKDWSICKKEDCFGALAGKSCFSYTNDASLLLPSTAMTGNYRIVGMPAWTSPPQGSNSQGFTWPPYFAVTATQDDTKVVVQLGPNAQVAAGSGLPAAGPGQTFEFKLSAGDVAQIIGGDTPDNDFSGTLVKASAPVQIVSGMACTQYPHGSVACDHVEETVLPVETLGKRYFVTAPSSPEGGPAPYVVRLVGNVDGTQLTYPGGQPSGAPSTLDAGQVFELPVLKESFEIQGDHELSVSVVQVGASLLYPGQTNQAQKGDPSLSFVAAVDQYRKRYVFLAPDNYDVSYADIVAPDDAEISLDGAPLGVPGQSLGSGYSLARVTLGPGQGGTHVLTASKPVGLQVMGYGAYTSYQYPGGLNLGQISPVPIK